MKPAGLRSEIIVNITLLTGAALLFAGFLLLKLTERELVIQRVEDMTSTMKIVAGALLDEDSIDNAAVKASTLLKAGHLPLVTWALLDSDLVPLSSPDRLPPQGFSDLGSIRFAQEPIIRMAYSSQWIPFSEEQQSFVDITVPIMRRNEFAGALQVRFSLFDVRKRVREAQKLVFFYAILYGAVLVGFGIYLLNRTVVRPVRRLQHGTQLVGAGNLDQFLPVEGPREIAELAGSFNTMLTALKESRKKTEGTIDSLRQTYEDLRRTRDELIQSERMASVGHLAAGMAHEIGNPLGAVVGYLELVRSELPAGREKEILELSLTEALRIDRLVRDLLDYASAGSVQQELLDPVTVVFEVRDILSHQGAFADLDLIDNLPPSLPPVLACRHRLVQVFINLMVNARDASHPRGVVRLQGGANGEDVWLSVSDEGKGMSADLLAHIFDPFYTTKANGKGLGLSVCYRVIKEAGGRIEVRSAEGKGSTFIVWLKRAENPDEV
jgi:signal transduction histidine kinase